VAKRAVVTGFILPVVMVREEMEERERVDEKFGKGNGEENRLSKRVIAAFPKVGLRSVTKTKGISNKWPVDSWLYP
jgi:hypothetical protein